VISRAPASTRISASRSKSLNGREISAPRVYGHDAVGAELVAPFLDRQERARPDARPRGQRGELGVRGHVGVGARSPRAARAIISGSR
jgi:hypothetical protein